MKRLLKAIEGLLPMIHEDGMEGESVWELAVLELEAAYKEQLQGSTYIILEDGKVSRVIDSDGAIVENARVVNLDDVFEDVCPVCKADDFGTICEHCGFNFEEENIAEAAKKAYSN